MLVVVLHCITYRIRGLSLLLALSFVRRLQPRRTNQRMEYLLNRLDVNINIVHKIRGEYGDDFPVILGGVNIVILVKNHKKYPKK